MKKKEEIIEQQKDFIQNLRKRTVDLINSIDKSEIQTILLSGSVSRADFFPRIKENGEYDGMVDLIVMRKNGSSVSAEDVFGPDQDPPIPYHCIKVDGLWFAILFTDFIDVDVFSKFEEPRKFSVLESQILYDPDGSYKKELEKINHFVKEDLKTLLNNSLGYIHYLISDYKKDRWYRRGAFIQLQENLNTAIRAGIRALFYMNGFYSPAEDRAIYYSHSLPELPQNYEELISKICCQNTDSEEDYFMREKLFMEKIVGFIESKNT
ncbi:MAG: hypothetical protein J6Y16_04515 [Treponema sp.]|nr:hypothetical protein [Treponema sp.]